MRPAPSTKRDTVLATRYVAPLREGGSLPGLVEGDDDGLWVVKFRGAGQAPKSLVAEWLAGELGRALGLPIPEMRRVRLDPALAMAEPDQEIQDLLRASPGINLGHRLPAGRPQLRSRRRAATSIPRWRRTSCGSTPW